MAMVGSIQEYIYTMWIRSSWQKLVVGKSGIPQPNHQENRKTSNPNNYKLTYSKNFNKLLKPKFTQPSSLSFYNKTRVYKLTCKECPKFDILDKQSDNLLTDS